MEPVNEAVTERINLKLVKLPNFEYLHDEPKNYLFINLDASDSCAVIEYLPYGSISSL